MITLLTLLLLLMLVAPVLLGRDKRLFHCLNLYCFLNVLLIVPGILVISSDPELLHPDIYMSVPPNIAGLAWTIAMIALLNLMVFVGYFWSARHSTGVALTPPSVLRPFESNFSIALLMALSFAVFLQKLSLFGGFSAIFDTVQNRVGLQAGLGPLNFLARAAAMLATIIATRRAVALRSVKALGVLGIMTLVSAVMFSLFGGRKDSIQLAVTVLVVFSLYRAEFMRLRPRTLLILASAYVVVLVYFMAILLYRNGIGSELSLESLIEQITQSFEDYQRFLLSLSYFDTYFFITNFFDSTNYYHGSTFFDLVTAFLPSGLIPDKPPVDDGMFVRAATLGYLLQPGTPGSLLTHNSFPPETLGVAYMNGGPWLVGFFGVLQGAVLGKAQNLVQRYPNSPFVIAFYVNVFLNFEISNLRIVQLLALSGCTVVLLGALRALALFIGSPSLSSIPPARPRLSRV